MVAERIDMVGREASEAAASGFEISSSVHDQAKLADMAGDDCIDVTIRHMASP